MALVTANKVELTQLRRGQFTFENKDIFLSGLGDVHQGIDMRPIIVCTKTQTMAPGAGSAGQFESR